MFAAPGASSDRSALLRDLTAGLLKVVIVHFVAAYVNPRS